MKTYQSLIGIYDEDILRGDLIHNKLEQLKYKVGFSCSSMIELVHYLEETPALLIFGVSEYTENAKRAILKIRDQYPDLKILLRISGCREKKELPVQADESLAVLANSSFGDLWCALEEMLPEHPLHKKNETRNVDIFSPAVSNDNPFFHIIHDQDKYNILKMWSMGKSNKEIAALTGIDYYKVEALRRLILKETESNNMTEAVSKAKDYHIL